MLTPSSLLKIKDSFQSGGAAQSEGPQTVEILSCEGVQASIRGPGLCTGGRGPGHRGQREGPERWRRAERRERAVSGEGGYLRSLFKTVNARKRACQTTSSGSWREGKR